MLDPKHPHKGWMWWYLTAIPAPRGRVDRKMKQSIGQ